MRNITFWNSVLHTLLRSQMVIVGQMPWLLVFLIQCVNRLFYRKVVNLLRFGRTSLNTPVQLQKRSIMMKDSPTVWSGYQNDYFCFNFLFFYFQCKCNRPILSSRIVRIYKQFTTDVKPMQYTTKLPFSHFNKFTIKVRIFVLFCRGLVV